jgi:hypothetical protein
LILDQQTDLFLAVFAAPNEGPNQLMMSSCVTPFAIALASFAER